MNIECFRLAAISDASSERTVAVDGELEWSVAARNQCRPVIASQCDREALVGRRFGQRELAVGVGHRGSERHDS